MLAGMIGWVSKIWAAVLLLCAVAAPQAARADEGLHASCHAATDLKRGIDYPQLPASTDWQCRNEGFDLAPEVAWAFYTSSDFASLGETPSHFVTQADRFDRITLIVMGADGPIRSRSYVMADVSNFTNGPTFALPLPDMRGGTGLVAAIERPWSPALVAKARLQNQHGYSDALGWSNEAMLAIALFVGLLAAPLLYHGAFYRILRERFVLWHMGMVVAMIAYVLMSSGLAHRVMDLDLGQTIFITKVSMMAPGLFATGFGICYVERCCLPNGVRRSLLIGAIVWMAAAVAVSLPVAGLRPYANCLLYLLCLPLVFAFYTASVMAWRRGSKDIRLLLLAWLPVSVIGIEVVFRGLGAYSGPDWLDWLIYGGYAFEVLITSIAVLRRMEAMRRDRDRVHARLDALNNLIELDALTGIYNRRALEKRFAELRSDGFHALAVVDLDHFKRINDQFGHTVGDRVLQEVASVLASDPDALAFRMGGEEFILMLRGAKVQQRAEQIRRAITVRIANEIEGIDSPVTASMGLVESPPGGTSTLRHIYSHADRLLYEAKYSGRNRLISERIQIFDIPSPERRAKDRRAKTRRRAVEDAA